MAAKVCFELLMISPRRLHTIIMACETSVILADTDEALSGEKLVECSSPQIQTSNRMKYAKANMRCRPKQIRRGDTSFRICIVAGRLW